MNKLILLFIIILSFVLRFYDLGKVPNGLYQDETAIGYNAYSILQTGKDEYGKSFPLYFKSFGDYKLPLYIYIDTIFIKIFGVSGFAVRFPSALFGVLTVLGIYFLVKELTQNKNLALLSGFMVSVNPWHLHYSRATFEVSISLFLLILGTYLLLKSKKGFFFLGTLCFILSLYGYNLTRLLSPALYIMVLLFKYRSKAMSVKREIVFSWVFGIMLLVPFLMTFFEKGGINSAKGTLFFTSGVIQSSLIEFRSYLVETPVFLNKLFFNSLELNLWHLIKNIVGYLSVNFLFLTGSSHGNHGIGNVGQFYIWELPLIVYGIIIVIKDKLKWGFLLFMWIAITVFIASLTREVPHATRSFFLIFSLEVLSSLGLLKFYKSNINKIIKIIFILLIFYNFIYYFVSYYKVFPVSYAKSWRYADRELSLFLKEHEKDYDQIVVNEDINYIYTSYLFYTQYPPEQFQNTVTRLPDDTEGFSRVVSFGKVIYKKIDWNIELKQPPKKLLITNSSNLPDGLAALRTFYYPMRPVVLSLKEQVLQYPVVETAYYVYESDPKK